MIEHRLLEILRDYAGFLPAALVSVVVSIVAAPHVGRRLGTSAALGWALTMSLGLVISATLTPSRAAILFGTVGSGTCDLTAFGPGTWWDLTHFGESVLNIALFMPLGASIALLPPSRARLLAILGTAVLPVVIELIQLFAVGLDRQCQASDVGENLLGVVVGLGIGVAGRAISQPLGGGATGGSRTDR